MGISTKSSRIPAAKRQINKILKPALNGCSLILVVVANSPIPIVKIAVSTIAIATNVTSKKAHKLDTV